MVATTMAQNWLGLVDVSATSEQEVDTFRQAFLDLSLRRRHPSPASLVHHAAVFVISSVHAALYVTPLHFLEHLQAHLKHSAFIHGLHCFLRLYCPQPSVLLLMWQGRWNVRQQ